MNSIFETPKIIPTFLIIYFQDIFEPPPPRLFCSPELLRKEYGNRKLKALMAIETMDTLSSQKQSFEY